MKRRIFALAATTLSLGAFGAHANGYVCNLFVGNQPRPGENMISFKFDGINPNAAGVLRYNFGVRMIDFDGAGNLEMKVTDPNGRMTKTVVLMGYEHPMIEIENPNEKVQAQCWLSASKSDDSAAAQY